MKKKIVGIFICVLLVGSVLPVNGNVITEERSLSIVSGNTLYVGGSGEGNYTNIQDAIDDALDGDTVFVYNGIYNENLRIVKDINLFGEDMEKTIIDGGEDTCVKIGGYINFSGFTIQNSDTGLMNLNLPPPDDNYRLIVFRNIIKNNKIGISIVGYLNHIIHGNTITNNELGINFFFADNCIVKNNNFIDNNKHAYFEYLLFFQFMPHINWNDNYWDDWKIKIPRPIIGQKSLIIIFRPGNVVRIAEFPWYNLDWTPTKEPYDFSEPEYASVVVKEENSKIKITLTTGGNNYPSNGYSFANSVTIRLNGTALDENNLVGNTGWEVGESLYIGGSTPTLDDDESAVNQLGLGTYFVTVIIMEIIIFDDTVTIV